MIRAVTADAARACDAKTIENGTPSKTLMRNAAQAVFEFLQKNGLTVKKTAIVCGKGNNGGDGYCLAGIMSDNGFSPTVFAVSGRLTPDADFYRGRFSGKGGEVRFEISDFTDYEVIVDALFGTGLSKPVGGIYAEIIEKINESGAYIVSCDIASGINTDNGLVMEHAVKADATITFQSAKCGHFLNDGVDYCGKLEVADIGVIEADDCISVTTAEDLTAFFPPLKRNVHKGIFGKSLIIGGSKNYIGAPLLAHIGDCALNVGCGLSFLAVPECIYNAVAARVLNNIVYTFPSPDGVITYDEKVLSKCADAQVATIGTGLGRCADINKIIEFMLEKSSAKLLLDADALNNLDLNVLEKQSGRILITPHPKEFSRLLNLPVSNVLENPTGYAKRFAVEYRCVVLLKGAVTVVTDGVKTALNVTGSPGMAKGGSGDLLDGIISGFAARGLTLFDSAVAGAFIAGRSAELALADGVNDYSMTAARRADYIAAAVNEIIALAK